MSRASSTVAANLVRAQSRARTNRSRGRRAKSTGVTSSTCTRFSPPKSLRA